MDDIVAGDTLAFSAEFASWPATDGWTLAYRLVPLSGAAITIAASANGSAYAVAVAAATTAGWKPGAYAWSAYVTKAGERHTLDRGRVQIRPDSGAASNIDLRSHARKVLDAIEAVLEKRATRDQMGYTINGRELRRTPIADLLELRSRYRAEVRAEEQADRLAQGQSDRRRLFVRLLRA